MLETSEVLVNFVDNLEEMQRLEKYLDFEPVFDVAEKFDQLKKIDATHVR